jgi:hypothetical protein
MSDPLARLSFTIRKDDWSYQVTCNEHPNYWLRLKREEDRDLITDFLLRPRKACPDDEDLTPLGGALLKQSYEELGLQPAPVIVFGDVLSSDDPPDLSGALSAAQALHTSYAEEVLQVAGYTISGSAIEKRVVDRGGVRLRTNKYDLIVTATAV